MVDNQCNLFVSNIDWSHTWTPGSVEREFWGWLTSRTIHVATKLMMSEGISKPFIYDTWNAYETGMCAAKRNSNQAAFTGEEALSSQEAFQNGWAGLFEQGNAWVSLSSCSLCVLLFCTLQMTNKKAGICLPIKWRDDLTSSSEWFAVVLLLCALFQIASSPDCWCTKCQAPLLQTGINTLFLIGLGSV